MKEEKMQNLRKAAQQALDYLEQHAIISGAPIRDALRAALEPVTDCHEKDGDKLSLPFNHFRDAGKMVATIRPGVTVEPVATINEMETVEPVAWMVYTLDGQSAFVTDNPAGLTPEHRALPLYTAPPKRKPLTDEQIEFMWEADNTSDEDCRSLYYFKVVARAIERAHGIGE